MKRYSLLVLLFFFTGRVLAQEPPRREVRLGLDVLKSLYPLALKKHPFPVEQIYHIEPMTLIECKKPGRFLAITAGYTYISRAAVQRNISLDLNGFYLKIGKEYQKRVLSTGWAFLLSNWQSRGEYRFTGDYFGDYTGIIAPFRQSAFGPEFYFATNYSLGRKLQLRLLARANILVPLPATPAIETEYIPGTGLVSSQRFLKVGGGFSAQLVYRIQPKSYENH